MENISFNNGAHALTSNITEQMQKIESSVPNARGSMLINNEGEAIYSHGFAN